MLHLLPVLLLSADAHAGNMATATLDAPVPVVADADLLPESGTWPCKLTLQVDEMGIVQTVTAARGCPSGLTDTARELGKGWHWQASSTPRVEEVTVLFTVLAFGEPEPKPGARPTGWCTLIRPLGVLPTPDGAAPAWKGKLPTPKVPRVAAAAGVSAGSCLVRLDFTPEGKVEKARASRCVDVLAEAALASVKRLQLQVSPLAPAPKELDLVVRFEVPDRQ